VSPDEIRASDPANYDMRKAIDIDEKNIQKFN
jgi:hypothetical protein